jgi:hypothetical protein
MNDPFGDAKAPGTKSDDRELRHVVSRHEASPDEPAGVLTGMSVT